MNKASSTQNPISAHPLDSSSDGYESADDRALDNPSPQKLPGPPSTKAAPLESGMKEASSREEASEQASTTGSLEDELLRIKNLATGKEISVEKKFTIRDLSTGQIFVIDGEPGPAKDPSVENATSTGLVTDVSSGRSMSLDEFDRTLGLHTALEATKRSHQNGLFRRPGGTGSAEASGDGSLSRAETGAGGEEEGAQTKKAAGKSWFKSKLQAAKQKLAGAMRAPGDQGNESDDDSVSQSGSSKLSMQREGIMEASPSGNLGQSVKVHVHLKLYKELTDLNLVQELHSHTGVVWAMKFSKNGRYLATGGQDCVIHVWEVILNRGQGCEEPGSPTSSPTSTSNDVVSDDEAGTRSAAGGSCSGTADAPCPVFRQTPFRTYSGHKQDVLDVSWSPSQFLLSASMDKTVRLWHISMDDCLRVFKHPDFVTSLDFHPVDDKVFLSGAIDGKVRVWSIPKQKVVHAEDCHEMVTAVTFSPGGQRAVVGTMKGKCRFFNVEPGFRLEYDAQIDVKNRRGQQSRGRKVTGMAFLPGDPTKLLVTSNDSRIRLYENYSMLMKYKGYHNRSTQIRASFSANGAFVISGSDDGWVYVWSSGGNLQGSSSSKREKSSSYECFHAHDDIVTVAVFAPESAWRAARLKAPVTVPKLTGLAEQLNRLGMLGKFSREEGVHAAAAGEDALCARRAYGQVIVTAGYSGGIKIFENLGTPHWL